jgi:hypothetical protein
MEYRMSVAPLASSPIQSAPPPAATASGTTPSDVGATAAYLQANPQQQDQVFDQLMRNDPGMIYHVQTALNQNQAAANTTELAPANSDSILLAGNNCHRIRNGCEPIFREPNPNATVQLSPGISVGSGGTSNVGRVQVTDADAAGLTPEKQAAVNRELATAHEQKFKEKIKDALVSAGVIPGATGLAAYFASGASSLRGGLLTAGVTAVGAAAAITESRRVIDRDYARDVNSIMEKYGLPAVTQNELLNSRAPNR